MTEVSLWVFGLQWSTSPRAPSGSATPWGPGGRPTASTIAMKCDEADQSVYRADEVRAPEGPLTFELRRAGGRRQDLSSRLGGEPSRWGVSSASGTPRDRSRAPTNACSTRTTARSGARAIRRGRCRTSSRRDIRSFYLMKRQITQAEYADFVNALDGSAKTCSIPVLDWQLPIRDLLAPGRRARRAAAGARVQLAELDRRRLLRGLGGAPADDGARVREGLPRARRARCPASSRGDRRGLEPARVIVGTRTAPRSSTATATWRARPRRSPAATAAPALCATTRSPRPGCRSRTRSSPRRARVHRSGAQGVHAVPRGPARPREPRITA